MMESSFHMSMSVFRLYSLEHQTFSVHDSLSYLAIFSILLSTNRLGIENFLKSKPRAKSNEVQWSETKYAFRRHLVEGM